MINVVKQSRFADVTTRRFLENARELLADLADFVAARGSAVCVWYTCGPKDKALWWVSFNKAQV